MQRQCTPGDFVAVNREFLANTRNDNGARMKECVMFCYAHANGTHCAVAWFHGPKCRTCKVRLDQCTPIPDFGTLTLVRERWQATVAPMRSLAPPAYLVLPGFLKEGVHHSRYALEASFPASRATDKFRECIEACTPSDQTCPLSLEPLRHGVKVISTVVDQRTGEYSNTFTANAPALGSLINAQICAKFCGQTCDVSNLPSIVDHLNRHDIENPLSRKKMPKAIAIANARGGDTPASESLVLHHAVTAFVPWANETPSPLWDAEAGTGIKRPAATVVPDDSSSDDDDDSDDDDSDDEEWIEDDSGDAGPADPDEAASRILLGDPAADDRRVRARTD